MIGIIDDSGKLPISNGTTIPILVVVLLVLIAFYLLRAFGLSTMAKKSDDKKVNRIFYFAFIPFLWVYLAGKLAGSISFFGFRTKNFVLIITIAFVASGVLSLAFNIYCYYPLVKYFLEGNIVYIDLVGSSHGIPYYFNDMFMLEKDLGIDLADGTISALNAISIVFNLLQNIAEIGMIFVYVELFRKYWPRHVWAGSIFSIFGLFPIFVFAVRKNPPVKYSEYIYNQYRNIYNANNPGENNKPNDDPFADYNRTFNNTSNNFGVNTNKEDDPFSEFSDKDK